MAWPHIDWGRTGQARKLRLLAGGSGRAAVMAPKIKKEGKAKKADAGAKASKAAKETIYLVAQPPAAAAATAAAAPAATGILATAAAAAAAAAPAAVPVAAPAGAPAAAPEVAPPLPAEDLQQRIEAIRKEMHLAAAPEREDYELSLIHI